MPRFSANMNDFVPNCRMKNKPQIHYPWDFCSNRGRRHFVLLSMSVCLEPTWYPDPVLIAVVEKWFMNVFIMTQDLNTCLMFLFTAFWGDGMNRIWWYCQFFVAVEAISQIWLRLKEFKQNIYHTGRKVIFELSVWIILCPGIRPWLRPLRSSSGYWGIWLWCTFLGFCWDGPSFASLQIPAALRVVSSLLGTLNINTVFFIYVVH